MVKPSPVPKVKKTLQLTEDVVKALGADIAARVLSGALSTPYGAESATVEEALRKHLGMAPLGEEAKK